MPTMGLRSGLNSRMELRQGRRSGVLGFNSSLSARRFAAPPWLASLFLVM